MRATVLVRPKGGILDPQGQAVERSLRQLGFPVGDARVGRVIDLDVDAATAEEARAEVEKMCERLLANPLIESYEIELEAEAARHERAAPAHRRPRLPRLERRPRRRLGPDRLGAEPQLVWHAETELPRVDAVVLPGGFSYGDYLRAGAIARFAPAMDAVADFAHEGGPVLGICNGFQILCEAGLLPGVLRPNASLSFVCRDVPLLVERADTLFTARCEPGQPLVIPVKHGDGCYQAPADLPAEQVVLRYEPGENPNGSTATSPP